MNKNIILIALLCLLSIDRVGAQSVTVEAKIDSLQILIGEQAKIQLQVAMDAKQRAVFPAYTDTLVRGVEIIETAKPDTQFLNDRQRMMITQEYTVTSFDSALYYLPPMPVTVDGKEYRSRALALKVYSIPVDTLHPDQFWIFIHILLLVQAYVQEKEDYLMKNNYLKLLKQTMFTNLKIILKVFLIMLTY